MSDGSGGAPGAVAEAAGKIGGSLFSGIKDQFTESVKTGVSQITGVQVVQKAQQNQKSIQQIKDKHDAIDSPQLAAAQAKLEELKNPKASQNTTQSAEPSNIKQVQSFDGNGKNPILAQRLHDEQQGNLAYHPTRWAEEAAQRQKQEEAQKKQQEEMLEEQKKEEEEKKKMTAPVMPSSGKAKGPGAPQQQKGQANQLESVKQAVSKDYGRQAKG